MEFNKEMEEVIMSDRVLRAYDHEAEDIEAFKLQQYANGEQAGRKQGFEQGIEQGIEKGIEQGKKENSIEMAKNMLKDFDLKTVQKYTNLSIRELQKLFKEINKKTEVSQ